MLGQQTVVSAKPNVKSIRDLAGKTIGVGSLGAQLHQTMIGTTGIAIWMPQFIKRFGLSTLKTSLVAAIPFVFIAVAMIILGRHSDKTGERVWHTAGPFIASAIGCVIAAFASNPFIGVIGLTIGAAGSGGAQRSPADRQRGRGLRSVEG